ncbi:MAG: cell division protein FtsQ/DivIB [Bacteroidota bacterium]
MKRNIGTIVFFALSIISMMVLIVIAGYKNVSRQVANVEVEIEDQRGDFFTDQLEVIDLLNDQGGDYVLGLSVGNLDLNVLESRVEKHPFIKEAQVYKDIKGNLLIHVEQARPLARILDKSGKDRYIDETGTLLPTTTKHTSRVMIIELEHQFSWEKNITESDYGSELLELIKFINDDEFWRAQIAEIVVKKDGELIMLPQVTKQEIEFGMPGDYKEKFRKLRLFYKEILPNKGWNTYSRVNVKFDNQLICE